MQDWRRQRDRALIHAGFVDRTGRASYGAYIASARWKNTRKRYFANHARACWICTRSSVPIVLHHRTYANIGYELTEDLVPLCSRCHSLVHDFRTTGKSFSGSVRALRWTYRVKGEKELQWLTKARRMRSGSRKIRRKVISSKIKVVNAADLTPEQRAKYALDKPGRAGSVSAWTQKLEPVPQFLGVEDPLPKVGG